MSCCHRRIVERHTKLTSRHHQRKYFVSIAAKLLKKGNFGEGAGVNVRMMYGGLVVTLATLRLINCRFIIITGSTLHRFGCWSSGMELPATGGYVGTVSGDFPHSTQDCSLSNILTCRRYSVLQQCNILLAYYRVRNYAPVEINGLQITTA